MMKPLLSALVLLVFTVSSVADTVVIQGDQVNARSNAKNFRTNSNVLAVIPKGTEGEIVDKIRMPSGNYGIKIRITKIGGDVASNLKIGKEVWVYYHLNKDDRIIELYNDQNQIVSAKKASRSKALKSFKIAQNTEAKTPAENCPPGTTLDTKTQDQVNQQINGLQKFAQADIPELDVSVEEIYTYINSVRPGHDKINHKIAENVKKYCDKENYSVLKTLAVMTQESGFNPNAESNKKKKASKRAGGLLQLLAGTAKELNGGKSANRFDIETNCRLGIKHLKEMDDKYGGDFSKVLIGYNAGEGRLKAITEGRKGIPSETRDYITKVTGFYNDYQNIAVKTGILAADPVADNGNFSRTGT